jgi:hypothetical protein
MQEMDHIAKAMPHGNAVSLLAATSSERRIVERVLGRIGEYM